MFVDGIRTGEDDSLNIVSNESTSKVRIDALTIMFQETVLGLEVFDVTVGFK